MAILVDNPMRDLPGLVLVAMKLCELGAVCYLVPMNWRERELWALGPDFVLLNYLRVKNEKLAADLLDAGVLVGVLDTEGGVMASLDSYETSLAPNRDIRHRITKFFSWGPVLAEHAVARGWYRRDQMAVTGSPRMDLYAAPWRDAARAAIAGSIPSEKPLVLVNSSFPLANPAFATPEEEGRVLVEMFGWDPVVVEKSQADQRFAMRELTRLANRLADRFPEAMFVYRPHPFERVAGYDGLLNARDNLRLIKSGTADGWILNSKVLIQCGSSTAVEAGLADVPTLKPDWIPTMLEQPSSDTVSIRCDSEEAVAANVAAVLQGRTVSSPSLRLCLDRVITDWFYANDGGSHARVAAGIWDALKAKPRPTNLKRCASRLYRSGSHSRRAVARALARRVLRLPPQASHAQRSASAAWVESEKYFGRGAVSDWAEHLYRVSDGTGMSLPRVEVCSAGIGGDYTHRIDSKSVRVAAE